MSAESVDPLVSIGMPVFNASATITRALESLLAQSHSNLEVIVSDNASTDGTTEAVEAVAAGDRRVQLVVQPENRGAVANFRSVLHQANSEYFMWAADDDVWDPRFIEATLERLRSDASLCGVVSRVGWRGDEAEESHSAGTFPLSDTARRNVARYLRHARDNSRFYGLFRRQALIESFPERSFYSVDLATMAATLRFGGHGEVPDTLMWRSRNDPSSYVSYVDVENEPGLERWLPMLPMTRYLVSKNVPLSASAWMTLIVRNVYEHVRYAAQGSGPYGALTRGLLRLAQPLRRRHVSTD